MSVYEGEAVADLIEEAFRAPTETARRVCPHAAALRQVADDLRIVWLVADNLRHDVAAEPGMEASEVLRRILAELPAVPDIPEDVGP